MTGWVVFGIAVLLIVVTSLAIRFQREAADECGEFADDRDLTSLRAYGEHLDALARATGTETTR